MPAWARNGRLLNIGDGGKDGDLDFADHRLAQGYAVANSNMGHDNGVEPGASFGFNNRQAEIDFGYRAVHLTANASKSVVTAYYGRSAQHSYFEGCSTGGREALLEVQRFPCDFDGIVAGAPVIFYQKANATHVWMLQRIFRDNLAGNLAYGQDGDGVPESLTKFDLLIDAVLAKCNGVDGITDGVIDNPLACDFQPEVELAEKMCPDNVNGDACFTTQQLQTIKDIYRGGHTTAKASESSRANLWGPNRVGHRAFSLTQAIPCHPVDWPRLSVRKPLPTTSTTSFMKMIREFPCPLSTTSLRCPIRPESLLNMPGGNSISTMSPPAKET